jgi:hypothetical protein
MKFDPPRICPFPDTIETFCATAEVINASPAITGNVNLKQFKITYLLMQSMNMVGLERTRRNFSVPQRLKRKRGEPKPPSF